MSHPNFPNPARRARILQAHQLRSQGLTLREIAKIMGCAHSTVAGYLRDYELFRLDLMREVAADQIVIHAIQLAQVDSDHHDRRLAAMREFRLLLTALPEMRRDEDDRTRELTSGGVIVDRYGNRYPTRDRFYPPTEEEQQQSKEPPTQLPAGRPSPDVVLYCPPLPESTSEPKSEPEPEPAAELKSEQPVETEQNRTESNKTEQESTSNPAQDSTSANPDQNSPDQSTKSIEKAIKKLDHQLEMALQHRDWLNDYPPHNPYHPERQRALRLVEKKQALEAQLAAATQEDPAAA